MADTGTPPTIPSEFQQYNSYEEDPKWQKKFTIIWTSIAAFVVFVSLCKLAIGFSSRRWPYLDAFFGIHEDPRDRFGTYQVVRNEDKASPVAQTSRTVASKRARWSIPSRLFSSLRSVFYWTLPGIGLNMGQMCLIASYAAAVVACIVKDAPLRDNPNRAGFLALAQLTPVFLFSMKNSPLSLLLSPPLFSYTHINFLHRWAGRTLFLSAVIHGSLWIRNHLQWNLPILGQQKETSGVAAFTVLCVIVLSSLRPVRLWCWEWFYWIHFLTFPAFFITVCYHTIYAAPWIYPPIAFYAFDVLMRMLRYRVKDAELIQVDNQMTLIRIPFCEKGFRAGQYIRLRVFFEGRGVFESHPFSIMSAPSTPAMKTCLRASDVDAYLRRPEKSSNSEEDLSAALHRSNTDEAAGILLGVRVVGDWTRALNEFVRKEGERLYSTPSAGTSPPISDAVIAIPTQVMFDGPYGGCSIDLTTYERVLLLAGGSGATFAIGMLDELVAECSARNTSTKRIEFVWCVRSYGCIKWFAPLLRAIAATSVSLSHIELYMTVYVTCMCSPEPLPLIPNFDVRVGWRPKLNQLMSGLLRAGRGRLEKGIAVDGALEVENGSEEEMCDCGCVEVQDETGASEAADKPDEKDAVVKEVVDDEETFDGSLGVCVSGPGSLTRDVANVVASHMAKGRQIGLHTEVFSV